jgi:ABC-type dipeptide/oligopeptide/nickel transport system permease component
VGQATPFFWMGIMLILIVSLELGWLPTSGRGTWQHLVLPAVTLATHLAAILARLTRTSMLEVLGQHYITTARAKGLRERSVILVHALKNAAVPVVTLIGLQFGTLLGGAVVTETVFAWPGVGRLAVQSIFVRDYPVVQASVFVLALSFVTINLAVDLLYGYLDPRIRTLEGSAAA